MGNCFIDTCCCQFNFIIFPAPRKTVGWEYQTQTWAGNNIGDSEITVELKNFKNQENEKVPFIEISNQKSKKKNEIIIYFHGNAQDIFNSVDFVSPIFRSTQITILCLEYPTYSCYESDKKYFISDRIKNNCVQFHNFIQKNYNVSSQKIYIVGRSIGSGPASYLASQVKCQKLTLISPFDTIKKVSKGHVGCIGLVVKNHFDNEESILNHKGQLLVIHGRMDEVINFRHGKHLVDVYQNQHNKKCRFIQPPRMSHNNFDITNDIVNPLREFLKN